MKRPKLTRDERTWLRECCKALGEQYPGAVRRLLIYGSKARGDAAPESDLDVLLVIRNEDAKRKGEVGWTGHMLAVTSDVVPSITLYTEDEWKHRRQIRSPFRANVERDAVQVR